MNSANLLKCFILYTYKWRLTSFGFERTGLLWRIWQPAFVKTYCVHCFFYSQLEKGVCRHGSVKLEISNTKQKSRKFFFFLGIRSLVTLFLQERINIHVIKTVSTSSITLKENLKYNYPLPKEFIASPLQQLQPTALVGLLALLEGMLSLCCDF